FILIQWLQLLQLVANDVNVGIGWVATLALAFIQPDFNGIQRGLTMQDQAGCPLIFDGLTDLLALGLLQVSGIDYHRIARCENLGGELGQAGVGLLAQFGGIQTCVQPVAVVAAEQTLALDVGAYADDPEAADQLLAQGAFAGAGYAVGKQTEAARYLGVAFGQGNI